jgi:nucleoside-diphosphate-sugar epimerase
MANKLPSIIVTGASGFVGRNFLEAVKENYYIYGIARRSRTEAGVAYHPNIHWIQCDIANKSSVNEVMHHIIEQGGADFVLHLAAFYDFNYTESTEYQRTNVNGTKNILELAKEIGIRRFIFASSLAGSNFPAKGVYNTEKSPLDANYAYAHSKKEGEKMVREYSKWFSCSVVRFAAVFSDWCEYAPLYKFLTTWLSRRWDSRILAGKGESAVSYIHIRCLVKLLISILNMNESLPSFDIYAASPDGSTSHRELFQIATHYYLGQSKKPIFIPKPLTYPGIMFRNLLQSLRLTPDEHFEQLWMLKYIDLKLNIDSSYTRKALSWEPTPRHHITRRLLFLIEKMKSHPDEWHLKNEAALKRVTRRANLMIYENMVAEKQKLLKKITDHILSPERGISFSGYRKMDLDDLQCYLSNLYHLLMAAVRSGDRGLMLNYIDDIAMIRFAEGFEPVTIRDMLSVFNDIITSVLFSKKELQSIKHEIYDYISMTIQLAQDEVEDLYETLEQKIPRDRIPEASLLPKCKEIEKLVRQLSAIYQVFPEERDEK